jgi:hypothetical protein
MSGCVGQFADPGHHDPHPYSPSVQHADCAATCLAASPRIWLANSTGSCRVSRAHPPIKKLPHGRARCAALNRPPQCGTAPRGGLLCGRHFQAALAKRLPLHAEPRSDCCAHHSADTSQPGSPSYSVSASSTLCAASALVIWPTSRPGTCLASSTRFRASCRLWAPPRARAVPRGPRSAR